tara:strand:- start:624 stop:1022 length:399 start_codon:yes stop_codon:yes gene_type:complete
MNTFKIDDNEYRISDLTPDQKKLLSNLKHIKDLINEKTAKNEIFKNHKRDLHKQLSEKLGSEIAEIKTTRKNPVAILKNGKKCSLAKIEKESKIQILQLISVNANLLETFNILQVLDTAKLQYSKEFYLKTK